jgi:hypothetical protein
MTQPPRAPWTEIVICGLLGLLCAFLFVAYIRPIPENLREVEGELISRTPTHSSKKKLTGFRFCLDEPRLTFTYSDPAPRLFDAWWEVSRASHVRVLYSQPTYGNPDLWGLTVNGHVLATPQELYSARRRHSLVWLAGALLALGYGLYAWRRWQGERSNSSSKPTPLRGAA